MGTRTAPPPPSTGARRPRTRYADIWSTTVLLTCAGLGGSALVQSPLRPLLALVVVMAGWAALVCAWLPLLGPRTPRRVSVAALAGGCGVLVLVGAGHDPAIGMASLGVLAGASPWTLRWVAGR